MMEMGKKLSVFNALDGREMCNSREFLVDSSKLNVNLKYRDEKVENCRQIDDEIH